MARALWFLALLSAFFVVAVRCLNLAAAPASVAVSSAEARSDEDEPLSSADVDDDWDDRADSLAAVAAPAITPLVTFTDTQGTGLESGALVSQRALPSHVASLERPPRV
ncbi:MAG: hypothetical protein ABI488_08385 [Polyangiaceae bacterium]